MKKPPLEKARGSRTNRPIMVLLDLLGRRMTLRLLWELSVSPAPSTFRALQGAAETNPSVLNARLGELRAAGLVEHQEGGYGLTEAGRALCGLLTPLHAWSLAWAERWPEDISAPEPAALASDAEEPRKRKPAP